MTSLLHSINISTSEGFFWWRPACWLRVTGDDALSFLQGQFTNDLRPLGPGGAVYGLWLDVKGKVLADSFVVRGATGEFWLGSYESLGAVVRERLERNLVADDVILEDATEGWAAVTLLGDGADAQPASRDVLNWPSRRVPRGGRDWVFPVAAEPGVRAQLAGRKEWSRDDMERVRIAAGIPMVPRDVGPGDLPNEAGLEDEAISYTKGCYLGQEIMARLKSMGQVRRQLRRVRGLVNGLPNCPTPLYRDEKRAGDLRSVVALADGSAMGLAMLSRLTAGTGAALALAAGAPAEWHVDDVT